MDNDNKSDYGYQEKDEKYFSGVRKEIIPLLPSQNEHILEIGCGAGSTLSYLKNKGLCRWTAGVELFPGAASEAKKCLDEAYEGNIEQMDLPFSAGQFDTILCLDILEHLIDPWSVVQRLDSLLKPGGVLIASIPNVRYYKVSMKLLFKGQWDYKSEGILDRTHLRFFTYKTARELLEVSGLKVDNVLFNGIKKGSPHYRTNLLAFGRLTHLLTEQYLLRAVKAPQK